MKASLFFAALLAVEAPATAFAQGSQDASPPVMILESKDYAFPAGSDVVIVRRVAADPSDVIVLRNGKHSKKAISDALLQLAVIRSFDGRLPTRDATFTGTSSPRQESKLKDRDDALGQLAYDMLKAAEEKDVPGLGRGRVVVVKPGDSKVTSKKEP